MRGWLFPYGIWYAVVVLCALSGAAGVAAGNVSGAVANGAVVLVVGMITVRSRVRWSRSGEKAARADLMRLVDARAGSGTVAWLDRDGHLLFHASRNRMAGMRGRTLLVIDEGQLRDVDDMRAVGGGKIALTDVSYMAHPVFARVLRRTDGTTALVTADDIEQADPPVVRESWWRGYGGMIRTIRAGLAYADAGELAGVVAQFRDAEPIDRESES
jgi:hypothetical protein